jgi:ATP/maltotriose-dependent transcriptional regulator MalT
MPRFDSASPITLAPREREVLEMIAAGLTNAEIAGILGIPLATARDHVAAVIATLGVATREQAGARWRRLQRRAGITTRWTAWLRELSHRIAV